MSGCSSCRFVFDIGPGKGYCYAAEAQEKYKIQQSAVADEGHQAMTQAQSLYSTRLSALCRLYPVLCRLHSPAGSEIETRLLDLPAYSTPITSSNVRSFSAIRFHEPASCVPK